MVRVLDGATRQLGEKAGRRLGYMGRISNVLMGALGNTVSATK